MPIPSVLGLRPTATTTTKVPATGTTPAKADPPPRTFEGSLKMIPGVSVPLRSMLVCARGDDILISPTGADAELRTVRPGAVLVAPSLLHHKHLQEAIERFTPPAVWAPPGFTEKLPDFARHVKTFGMDAWPYTEELEFEVVGGAPMRNEVVLFHRASRTIYTADLVFNLAKPSGILSPIAFRLMGIYNKFAVAKMWTSWVKDHAAFRASMDRILAWDFERIVMAHGEVVPANGRRMLLDALRERDLLRRS